MPKLWFNVFFIPLIPIYFLVEIATSSTDDILALTNLVQNNQNLAYPDFYQAWQIQVEAAPTLLNKGG